MKESLYTKNTDPRIDQYFSFKTAAELLEAV